MDFLNKIGTKADNRTHTIINFFIIPSLNSKKHRLSLYETSVLIFCLFENAAALTSDVPLVDAIIPHISYGVNRGYYSSKNESCSVCSFKKLCL